MELFEVQVVLALVVKCSAGADVFVEVFFCMSGVAVRKMFLKLLSFKGNAFLFSYFYNILFSYLLLLTFTTNFFYLEMVINVT